MNHNFRKTRTRPVEKGVVRYIEHSVAIAKQIISILNKLDKSQAYLANQLNKKESEISKWLQGSHNFTLKTISKIEDVLGESIIVCPQNTKLNKHFWVYSDSKIIRLVGEKKNSQKRFNNIKISLESGVSKVNTDCLLSN